jgi:CHAD domain-containing protein
MGLAGDVRDCDIALRLLAKSDWPDRGSLQQGAQTRRKESERALNAALRLWVARKTSAKWRAALESSPSAKGFCYRPVPETAAKQLVGMAKDFFRSGDRAVEDRAPAAELHEFRIAAKRFRYTLELFAEVYGASAGERVERIKSAQTLLGDINDCRTARQLLAELGGGKRIDAALKRKQRRRAQAFREMWAKEFGGPAVAKEWIEGLGRPAEMPRRKPMARSAAAGHAEGFARGA